MSLPLGTFRKTSLIPRYGRQVPVATTNNKLTSSWSLLSLTMAFFHWFSTTKQINKSGSVVVHFKFYLIYVCSFSRAVFISITQLLWPRLVPWPWWAIFNQILKQSDTRQQSTVVKLYTLVTIVLLISLHCHFCFCCCWVWPKGPLSRSAWWATTAGFTCCSQA
jgi:hypothetical protein